MVVHKQKLIFQLDNVQSKFHTPLSILREEFSLKLSLTSMSLVSMQNVQCIAEYYYIL